MKRSLTSLFVAVLVLSLLMLYTTEQARLSEIDKKTDIQKDLISLRKTYQKEKESSKDAEQKIDYLMFLVNTLDRQAQIRTVRASRSRPRTTVTTTKVLTSATASTPVTGWMPVLQKYNWNAALAHKVMLCESRGNPNAYNRRSGATGLFQILRGPFDPYQNIELAYQMYSRRGWQPWNASRGCWSR